MFLGVVNIFITLARLQASPKLSNFGLYTAPDGQKSQNVPDRSEHVKMRFFANLNFGPRDFTKVMKMLTKPKNIFRDLNLPKKHHTTPW